MKVCRGVTCTGLLSTVEGKLENGTRSRTTGWGAWLSDENIRPSTNRASMERVRLAAAGAHRAGGGKIP